MADSSIQRMSRSGAAEALRVVGGPDFDRGGAVAVRAVEGEDLLSLVVLVVLALHEPGHVDGLEERVELRASELVVLREQVDPERALAVAAVRVLVELARVQRVEEDLPRGAERLASSPAGHEVAEPDELAVSGRGVERGLPLVRLVRPRAGQEPVELRREVAGEAREPLGSDRVGGIRAPGEGRANVNHALLLSSGAQLHGCDSGVRIHEASPPQEAAPPGRVDQADALPARLYAPRGALADRVVVVGHHRLPAVPAVLHGRGCWQVGQLVQK
jgi:hypothetical protein